MRDTYLEDYFHWAILRVQNSCGDDHSLLHCSPYEPIKRKKKRKSRFNDKKRSSSCLKTVKEREKERRGKAKADPL